VAGISITRETPGARKTLGKTFITALLLTGSARRAEAAILEAIEVMEEGKVPDDALLHGIVAASIASRTPDARIDEEDHASSLLPVELRLVLRLPVDLRRCFVLRMLAGFSIGTCARMLQTEIHQVEELVCVSVRALASLSEHGASLIRTFEVVR